MKVRLPASDGTCSEESMTPLYKSSVFTNLRSPNTRSSPWDEGQRDKKISQETFPVILQSSFRLVQIHGQRDPSTFGPNLCNRQLVSVPLSSPDADQKE